MRRLLAPMLGALLVLSSAAAVSADEPDVQFDPLACALFFGGEMTVDPGSSVGVFSGWTATTRGQLEAFTRASTWVLTVDDESIDVTPFIEPPTKLDTKFWLSIWRYPLGTLGLGDTMTITLDLILKHPNYDGFFLYPAGSVFGGPVTCVVTGAEAPPEE